MTCRLFAGFFTGIFYPIGKRVSAMIDRFLPGLLVSRSAEGSALKGWFQKGTTKMHAGEK